MKSHLNLPLVFTLVLVAISIGCKKENNDPPLVKEMLTRNFPVESIIAPGGGQSTSNLTFFNLYDGIVLNKAAAELNSSSVDFAYNYRGGGCPTCRFFENVKNMSTRTGYVGSFSTITDSRITNAEQYHDVSIDEFDALNNGTEIENLFNSKVDSTSLHGSADITDRVTDVAQGRVFAFRDKVGRKGFFKIGDYVANVPDGDKATLQLTVKIVKD